MGKMKFGEGGSPTIQIIEKEIIVEKIVPVETEVVRYMKPLPLEIDAYTRKEVTINLNKLSKESKQYTKDKFNEVESSLEGVTQELDKLGDDVYKFHHRSMEAFKYNEKFLINMANDFELKANKLKFYMFVLGIVALVGILT